MKFPFTTIILIVVSSLSVLAQSKQTDRYFEGLKGQVKTILTERADAKKKSGKFVESKRRKVEFVSYDKNGNRLTWKTYDWQDGLLFESVTYKLLDGDKVSVYERVDNPNVITATVPGNMPAKPSDPRYEYKFKYKYDELGNVSEEAWWQSDGDLWLRYTYKLKGSERDELVYSGDGSLNQKFKYTLDSKGNEVEMISYDTETGKVEGKEKYTYLQFDAKGNWTKRMEWEADAESKWVLKPREVKYRTISYYS